mmetsp:Transcript_246/g.552  ORF Transcript_246/g.552 Transcript_246/m.552 type:complete len:137 (-) Transcript_246:265-675(-)|eukprot:CAMPEP_0116090640 /NCGR_PEP_ID=MMETSP0327-20121206/7080_1 /TAXON_ID=44447 /ORGANISM="Pseudo-nitzschia delicatissima, Strain B596" /LENGTH=136 /DNA_ID=CAMNT_0003581939 /DNA_START=135 /DNA_END=545 /DNA_ORIENTATION=+
MIGKSTKILLGALLAASNVAALHYEMPPCGEDEKAVQLMGIDGVFCSPQCDPDCPTDPPDGVTAMPTCALQSPDGSKYCAILCSPSDSGRLGGECGPDMDCLPIPQSGGFGICEYPLSLGLRASAQYQEMTFAITE